MLKFLKKGSLAIFILFLIFSGGYPAFSAETSTDSPWQFLRDQNVLKPGEEELDAQRFLKREEWVRWVLRSDDFVGDGVVQEPFRDVANNSYISKAWRLKAVKTAPNFAPNRPITGAESLKILLKIRGISTERISEKDAGEWSDLPEELELRNAVLRAVQLDIWQPESSELLGVGKRLTREQGAEILFQILTAPEKEEGTITIKAGKKTPEELHQSKFDFIWETLHDTFLYEERLDDEKLIDKSLSGLLSSLQDKYTEYLPQPKTKQFEQNISGELEGIGAQLGVNDEDQVLIVKVFPDTPAERARLRPGDIIRKVDGQDMTGKTPPEVASFIKGPQGTSVTLTILRGSEEKELVIAREKIRIQYVEAKRDGNILSINVLTFGDRTAGDLRKALEEHLIDASVQGIVLDLRGNPGGGLNTVLEMLGDFLPEGVTGIWQEERDGTMKKRVITEGAPFLDIPLVVIIDKNSASASEIFAGAIQDYKRGLVIGSTSFGKGTVQHLITFPDGSSFKYTAARWLTPEKRSIDGVGIVPDIEVVPVEGEDKAYEVAKNLIKRGQAKPKTGVSP